jgi:hypothetical protein
VPSDTEPHGHKEVLGREPSASRGLLIAAGGILVVLLVAYGATFVVSSPRLQHHSAGFNMWAEIKNACAEDDGDVVTADPSGTPVAFPTPDGPQRYWCVSRHYLTSIGRPPTAPPPSLRKIPREYKWLWPRTTYGHG